MIRSRTNAAPAPKCDARRACPARRRGAPPAQRAGRVGLLLAVAASLLSSPVQAQDTDQALYGPGLPEDAVFLRWLDGDQTRDHAAFGATFPADGSDPDAFQAISAALLEGAAAGAVYSMIPDGSGSFAIIAEPQRTDRAKANLTLLNADDAPVKLTVAGKSTEVIGATQPMTAGARAVNPVAASLSVEDAGTGAVLGSFDMRLRRGRDLTFLVEDGAVRLIEDSIVITKQD
jgi:hypothetical protein